MSCCLTCAVDNITRSRYKVKTFEKGRSLKTGKNQAPRKGVSHILFAPPTAGSATISLPRTTRVHGRAKGPCSIFAPETMTGRLSPERSWIAAGRIAKREICLRKSTLGTLTPQGGVLRLPVSPVRHHPLGILGGRSSLLLSNPVVSELVPALFRRRTTRHSPRTQCGSGSLFGACAPSPALCGLDFPERKTPQSGITRPGRLLSWAR